MIFQASNWLDIVKYLKTYGFFLQNGAIYSGLANNYDLGPLGSELKTQIIAVWKKQFVQQHENIHLIDGNILTKQEVLQASGHIQRFVDYVVVCRNCHGQNKLEHLWPKLVVNDQNFAAMQKKVIELTSQNCQHCQKPIQPDIKRFNLLFQTGLGVAEQQKQTVYLRPETAQNIFVNLPALVRTMQLSLPFGIAQIGKVFRNEITTQNLIFRVCEFNQMEIEFFYDPTTDQTQWFSFWQNQIQNFLKNALQLNFQKIRIREHQTTELAHYSKRTIDFEYHFPFGWKELWGLADRGDYDLQVHQKASRKKMTIRNSQQQLCLPFVIEPSVGIERLMLALICDKLVIENAHDQKPRYLLKMPWTFCYYQIAVLPLTEKLTAAAYAVYQKFKTSYRMKFDAKKSIGRRYLYHDAIGTYYCLTYDFASATTETVTIRERDSKKQRRIAISDLAQFFANE